MSYSILINSNSNDALNLSKTRDLLQNIITAYKVDNAIISGLDFDISNIENLSKWLDDLNKLMNMFGSPETEIDVELEPIGLS